MGNNRPKKYGQGHMTYFFFNFAARFLSLERMNAD